MRTTAASDAAPFLPLSPALFHILLAIADGEKHGYAILKEVKRRTGGEVTLSAGTLYTAIGRLDGSGLIEESAHRPDPALDDERRRYFRLSALGRKVLIAEAERMEEALRQARAKKLFTKTRPA